jgi:glycosyltransferase involved in cell wall biosynthesis
VAVNDGSRDGSWKVLEDCAERFPHLVLIDLLRNYGQHTAVLCGLEHSRGDFIVTLDDDMQNPPGEIIHLIATAKQGHDVVFGSYRRKRHGWVRRLGSTLVNAINTRIFRKPPDLLLTNFRLLERRVVERILAHRTQHPYINGLSVLYARNPANVSVEHRPREVGTSNYSLLKIVELVMRILFGYSSYPLRLVSGLGLGFSLCSFLLGTYFLLRALLAETSVPGWASVVVMVSFFNGLSLALLGMLGEYTVRILHAVTLGPVYHVAEVRRRDA